MVKGTIILHHADLQTLSLYRDLSLNPVYTVHGVAKSRTGLSDVTFTFIDSYLVSYVGLACVLCSGLTSRCQQDGTLPQALGRIFFQTYRWLAERSLLWLLG